MGSISNELKAIFTKCRVPVDGKLWKFCEDNQVEDPSDLALFASSVDGLQANLFDKAMLTEVIEQVQARKAWSICFEAKSAASNATASVVAPPPDDDAPLSEDDYKSMQATWLKKCALNIPGSRTVASGVFNRMARGLNRTPRSVQVPLLENVRLVSAIDSAHDFKGGLIVSKSGVTDVTVTHTLVKSLRDLEWRMQAVFFCCFHLLHYVRSG